MFLGNGASPSVINLLKTNLGALKFSIDTFVLFSIYRLFFGKK